MEWKRKQKTDETQRVKWLWCAFEYLQKACEKVDLELNSDEDFVVIFCRRSIDMDGMT